MKVAIIYTAKTDELVEGLKNSIYEKLGRDTEIIEYQDITPLQETVKNGYISSVSGSKYIDLCLKAVSDNVDVILSTCCVMGDLVEPTKPLMTFLGVPVVSIDESFCRKALLENNTIYMLATAEVASYSVGHTLERYERILNLSRNIKRIIVKDTAGLTGDDLAKKIMEYIPKEIDDNTGVILAQPSMAFAGDYIRNNLTKKVYTAIDDPTDGLLRLLELKGKITR